jgi:hypothetical protein
LRVSFVHLAADGPDVVAGHGDIITSESGQSRA